MVNLRKIISGALKSAFDAHADEDGFLHRDLIPSVAKRLDLPVPNTTFDDRQQCLHLNEWRIKRAASGHIEFDFPENIAMRAPEAHRMALAILWLCEQEINDGPISEP